MGFLGCASEREGTPFQGYQFDQNPGRYEAITGERLHYCVGRCC